MPAEHLLAPLRIGPVTLPCRIASTSHQTTLVAGHLPTEDFIAYQAARARGGAGLIVMEAVAVAPSGLLTSHTLAGYLEPIVAGYRRVAEAVQPHGTKLFVQLFHGGREVIASPPRPVALSASARPSERFHTEPRALRTDEVEELVAAYGRCAGLAAEAGLDGIEVTAAHGYLAEQFFDPQINDRTDRYAEPSAFITEVLDAVRAAAPDLAVGVRLSADSPAAQGIAPALAPRVDYVHVAVGNSATFAGCSGIVPPPPAPRNLIAALTEPFRLGPPLLATTRIVDPLDADVLIASGAADAVGMTRALITDPDMPRKVRAGDHGQVLRCIGCNACIAHYHAETPIRCAQNPRTGRELHLPPPAVAERTRRLVVVGAGPAGLAAAAELAGAGHQVTVLERAEEIGGQARLAGAAPAHRELFDSLRANYEMLLAGARVEVRLASAADLDAIVAISPDGVVLATGARPLAPVPEPRETDWMQVWDVLAGARPRGSVLIADWGADATGLDCAELLAAEGHPVTLAVGAPVPGALVHQYARNRYLARLARAGVRLEHHLRLRSAAGGFATFSNIFAPELVTELRADTLLVSLGRAPEDALAESLHRHAQIPFESAGDCCSPRGLEEAILEGTLMARRLLERIACSPASIALANDTSARQPGAAT
jgi:2,4-dienoyl-CoA reductase-like NADH-dependent reductase (Old Yellow Enzyme family)